MDLISGRVRVELRCRYSERAVNICARHHIEFSDLTRTPEGNACLTVSIPGYMKLREVARDTGAFSSGGSGKGTRCFWGLHCAPYSRGCPRSMSGR